MSFVDSGSYAPNTMATRRRLAETMMQQGMQTGPVGHWTQGANRILQAMLGGYQMNKLADEEKAQTSAGNEALLGLLGPAQSAPAADYAPQPATAAQAGAAAAGREGDYGDPLALIRKEEGFAPVAQWDKRQFSGGYGSKAAEGETFTQEKAEEYLRRDAAAPIAWVEKNAPNATASQKAALVSFGYNLGTDDLDKLKPDIDRGDWKRVGERMLDFNKALNEKTGQLEPMDALKARRQREAALVMNGAVPTAAGAPAQASAMPEVDPATRQRIGALLANPATRELGQAMIKSIAMKRTGTQERGLTPVPMTDENGNTVLGTIGPDGTWKPLETGGKYSAAPKTTTRTEGADSVTRDVYGNEVARTPINIAEAERQQTTGKAQGQAQVDLPKVQSNASAVLAMTQSLRTDPDIGRMTGSIQGRMPNWSEASGRVQSKIDQLNGQAFLQAFEAIKGAGQITEIEGQKATAALTRLQTMTMSDADYLEAIKDFESEVNRLVQLAETRARGSAQAERQAQPGAPGKASPGVTTAGQPSARPGASVGSAAQQAQNDSPPASGARKAPDGNWYVEENGKFFRVDR
jgi:GH24 family phage-related lysozyme (muramidase)